MREDRRAQGGARLCREGRNRNVEDGVLEPRRFRVSFFSEEAWWGARGEEGY